MQLELTARANQDLKRVYDFNLRRSDAWADKVQKRLLDRAQALTDMGNPGRPLGRAGTFRLSVTDVQYVIDYEPATNAVRILRVRRTREIQ